VGSEAGACYRYAFLGAVPKPLLRSGLVWLPSLQIKELQESHRSSGPALVFRVKEIELHAVLLSQASLERRYVARRRMVSKFLVIMRLRENENSVIAS
jgi:hypothetical protein